MFSSTAGFRSPSRSCKPASPTAAPLPRRRCAPAHPPAWSSPRCSQSAPDRACLPAHQVSDQLVTVLDQPGESIMLLRRPHPESRHSYLRSPAASPDRARSETPAPAALHHHHRHAVHAVQARLDRVVRHLPKLGLRHRVRGQAVAHDRHQRREGQPVRGHFRRGRQSVGCTRASAAFTYCSVWNMSTFQLKNRLTSADPRLVMDRTSSTRARCSWPLRSAASPSPASGRWAPRRCRPDHDRGKSVDGNTATGMVLAR
jgi:hypothetical protein